MACCHLFRLYWRRPKHFSLTGFFFFFFFSGISSHNWQQIQTTSSEELAPQAQESPGCSPQCFRSESQGLLCFLVFKAMWLEGGKEEGDATWYGRPTEPELFTSIEQEGSIEPCPNTQSGHRLGMYLDYEFGKYSLDLPVRANHCLSGKDCAHF